MFGQGSARIDPQPYVGIMKQELFVDILASTLSLSINALYPGGHRLMMDNDPKHTSRYAAAWMNAYGINWWRTPAESPDINPIENLWHELKEYQRRVVKPKTASRSSSMELENC